MTSLSCSQDTQSELQSLTVKISVYVSEGWCPYVSEVSERLFQVMGIQAASSRSQERFSLFSKADIPCSDRRTTICSPAFSLLNVEVGEDVHDP